jgi:uncharacterized protein
MLTISHYHIAKNVHIYRQGNLNIAYDVNSGSLHILDDKTAQFISQLIAIQEQGREENLNSERIFLKAGNHLQAQEREEILLELGELQKQNLLFSQEAEKFEPSYPEEPVIKALCLHVAHDCNLRCRYCFAETGSFGGSRGLMTFETGKSALDFLIKNSGDRVQCEVDFFGGEPLVNFPVVRRLIAYGRKAAGKAGRKMKFTLTTNAVLLDAAVSAYLEEEDVSIVLSLDGRQEVNDRMRPDAGGKGSYERIMPNILRFIAQRPDTSPYAIGKYYYVRGTYTHYNTDFYRDVLHMADQGIKRISVEPVVASPEMDYAFRPEDMAAIKESYDILAEKVLEYRQNGREFTFFHFNAGLAEGPCLPKRLAGCGAGFEYVAVSPEGDIYPCHQFVGQKRYRLGSLTGTSRLNQEIMKSFRQANINAKKECSSCWARYSCSGGCHAANVGFSGELTKVYPLACELQKKRLEVAFYLKIKEREQNILV